MLFRDLKSLTKEPKTPACLITTWRPLGLCAESGEHRAGVRRKKLAKKVWWSENAIGRESLWSGSQIFESSQRRVSILLWTLKPLVAFLK